MSLSQREKTLIIIALYALAIFCFVWLLYLPGQAKVTAMQADNQQLAQKKKRLEEQVQKAPVSGSIDLTTIKEKLPVHKEMIPVLKFLDESANKCDVELASLEYRGTKEDQGEAGILIFAVETSGSIYDLIDFLQGLLVSPRFLSMESISLNACKNESNGISQEESTPTYYIAPPGIPQAKLEQIKVEVEETEPYAEAHWRVADSFIPDQFEMNVTINAYYLPEQVANAAKGDETHKTDITKEATVGDETTDSKRYSR